MSRVYRGRAMAAGAHVGTVLEMLYFQCLEHVPIDLSLLDQYDPTDHGATVMLPREARREVVTRQRKRIDQRWLAVRLKHESYRRHR